MATHQYCTSRKVAFFFIVDELHWELFSKPAQEYTAVAVQYVDTGKQRFIHAFYCINFSTL